MVDYVNCFGNDYRASIMTIFGVGAQIAKQNLHTLNLFYSLVFISSVSLVHMLNLDLKLYLMRDLSSSFSKVTDTALPPVH